MEDLYWKQLDIDYPGVDGAMVFVATNTMLLSSMYVCACIYIVHMPCSFDLLPLIQVHHGFYSAYHNTSLRPGVLDAIQKAKALYGVTKIMVTGHSMGGAMAAFCGLDLRVIV